MRQVIGHLSLLVVAVTQNLVQPCWFIRTNSGDTRRIPGTPYSFLKIVERFIRDCHPDNLVKSQTDADNSTLSYQYVDLNRLTQIRKNDQSVLVSFHYDETVDGWEQKGFACYMRPVSYFLQLPIIRATI